MVMATYFYPNGKKYLMNGAVDLDTDTIYGMLVQDAYTPAAGHAFRSDVTNEVANSGSYAAGGAAIASAAVAVSGTEARFTGTIPAWTTFTGTARGIVIYKHRGGASSADELICALSFGSDVTATAGNFAVAFDATGLAALT